MSSLEILRGRTGGQLAAILQKVCGGDEEKLDALLRDEMEVELVERVLKLVDVDRNGRIIPSKDLKNAVCDPHKELYLKQPKLETLDDYKIRMIRFEEAFKSESCLTIAEFHGKANELIGEIGNSKNISNLLNGVYLPIILPRLDNFNDYGQVLEQIFLPAVRFSYERQFPNRGFCNYKEDNLAGKVGIAEGTEHRRLIAKMTEGYTVVIYFPNPMQGFSDLASREQFRVLPNSFLLAGGFDTAAAMTMYPDVLARDWHTPGLDLSALSWQSPDYSLRFRALDVELHFDDWTALGNVSKFYSSGLLFLGSA